MSEHEQINDWLPVYAAGGLDDEQRRRAAAHLAGCQACRADLALWQSVGAEIRVADRALEPPPSLASVALAQARMEKTRRPAWRPHAILQLLKMQALLVQKELWPVSAAVIAIGCVMTIHSNDVRILQGLAPLAAAAGVAALFRPEDEAAMELALSTPTSPRLILLARLALVFGYDLGLALLASLGLLAFLPALPLGQLIIGWLAPMAFLSMTALALSLVIGHDNAILASYSAWLLQFLPRGFEQAAFGDIPQALRAFFTAYSRIWSQPGALLSLAAAALAIALWLVETKGQRIPKASDHPFGLPGG